ncbi:MAG: lipopolysaccharide heptosyltransferase II [Alphaproteobacteria bacterium]|nr:lipopolysaccharide heptosyltransferase II [Alphaproteobacteria bacterium]
MNAPAGILVVGPAWVGDMVLAHSLFQVLKRDFPAARIGVAAPAWTLPLLRFMPEVDEAIALPFRHGDAKLMQRRRVGREIAQRGYDRAIVLPNSLKSALVPFFAGIPERIGYAGEGRAILLTEARRLDKAALPRTVDRFVALGLPAGAAVGDIPAPHLAVPAGAVDAALAAVGRQRQEAKLLALCPGAEYGEAKRWPAAFFAAVARRHLAGGGAVWLFGSPGDRAIAESVRTGCDGRAVNLAGQTDLAQVVALLSLADAVVTNDSGLMHVAAALGRRVVAVYGSSSPTMTPPMSATARALWLALPCSPCYQRACPLGHLDCLRKLEPDRVIAALEEA